MPTDKRLFLSAALAAGLGAIAIEQQTPIKRKPLNTRTEKNRAKAERRKARKGK